LQLIHGGTRVQDRAYGLPCSIRLASVNSLAAAQRCSSRDYAASSGGDLPGFSELEFFVTNQIQVAKSRLPVSMQFKERLRLNAQQESIGTKVQSIRSRES
jgi:hypothetical protein